MDVLDPQRIERAIAFARDLQERARELQTPAERRQQAGLDRMTERPADKVALLEITDQAFRTSTPSRSADQLVHVLDVQGIPQFPLVPRPDAPSRIPVVRQNAPRCRCATRSREDAPRDRERDPHRRTGSPR